ncbi:hypothetical protein [Peribacillus sp. CSMR9]|nr:hypothetical protein [Peribacillus sp. CSMR9]MDV7767233.1 hypothetical protein [Peribacillus sp. CSMR9]
MEIEKQSNPVKNNKRNIGMAKMVKKEKMKKILLTANISQLIINNELDKKSLIASIINFTTIWDILLVCIIYDFTISLGSSS